MLLPARRAGELGTTALLLVRTSNPDKLAFKCAKNSANVPAMHSVPLDTRVLTAKVFAK